MVRSCRSSGSYSAVTECRSTMQKNASPCSWVAAYWRKPPIRLPRCLSPVGWMPLKILMVRSILVEMPDAERGEAALGVHAAASPRGPCPEPVRDGHHVEI